MGKKINRIGETLINNYGNTITIIEYNNANNITVKFGDGSISKNRTYNEFKKRSIKSLYDKSQCGVGFLGEGKYTVKDNKNNQTLQYKYWFCMLYRCYNDICLKKEPQYKDCTVCEEWLCYQNFAEWFDKNYYKCIEELELDKDILHKGNKIYSPENCVFVPSRINKLLIKRQNYRGDYPIGVTFHENINKYRARCCTLTGRKSLGCYDTPHEAFSKGYKPFKEKYIKQVANEYKNIIPTKLYNALCNYEVEITD